MEIVKIERVEHHINDIDIDVTVLGRELVIDDVKLTIVSSDNRGMCISMKYGGRHDRFKRVMSRISRCMVRSKLTGLAVVIKFSVEDITVDYVISTIKDETPEYKSAIEGLIRKVIEFKKETDEMNRDRKQAIDKIDGDINALSLPIILVGKQTVCVEY